MFAGRTVLAVVPARGGSKSIPRKNLREVGGVSLVGRVGDLARSLDWLDACVLSTDDPEIAAEGQRHGLDVPFTRPADLAGDLAASHGVWRHALLAAEAHYGKTFDLSILLEPTSPLRQGEDLEATVRALLAGPHKSAVTVSPAPAHFTPQKCLTVSDGRIGFYHPQGSQHSTRQTIPAYYFRNGICYALSRDTLMREDVIIGDDCAAVIIDRPVVNIDDPLDLELAEFLQERERRRGD
jgi:CMP-N,N'-diacetyllegionaminic acid synthase